MNRKTLLLCLLTLALIGIAAVYLVQTKNSQHLGEPGVIIVNDPIFDPDGHQLGSQSVFLPNRVLDYKSEIQPITRVEFDMLPKDTLFGRRRYLSSNGVFLAVSAILAGTDRTAIHRPEYCLTGQGFKIIRVEKDRVKVPGSAPYDLPLSVMFLSFEGKAPSGQSIQQPAVFVYWYVTDDRVTANPFQRVRWTMWEVFRTGKMPRWAYVSCYILCGRGAEQAALDQIKQWIAAAAPEFQRPHRPAAASSVSGDFPDPPMAER